jgi:NADH dehydrogenase FAD-containing subunit
LTDGIGLIPVDRQYRHVDYEEVYAAGVACSFAELVPPLEGYRAPQTGYLSLRMGKIAATNLAASLGYASPSDRTLPHTLDVRVIDGRDAGLLLTSRGDRELHHSSRRLPGKTAHYLKRSSERLLLWQLRTGNVGVPISLDRLTQKAIAHVA